MPTLFLKLPAIILALAVILGAFGAHGLKNKVTPELLEVWEKAVLYHFFHGLALLMIVFYSTGSPDRWLTLRMPYLLFCSGIALFSGSLYCYVITQVKTFAMITPLGGLLFIAAWVMLAFKQA